MEEVNERRNEINERRNENNERRNEIDKKPLPTLIYRFKLSEETIKEIYSFAKIHQYDDRLDFKEAWVDWIKENEELIEDEKNRLLSLGYEGNVIDKMFKSARYYFRNKSNIKTIPKKRRNYISVPRELLDAMDNHIQENIYNEDYQPKTGFCEFCETNDNLLKEVVSKIIESGINDKKIIEDKLKKTYKNRYFTLTNK
jgi:hypothetical protein